MAKQRRGCDYIQIGEKTVLFSITTRNRPLDFASYFIGVGIDEGNFVNVHVWNQTDGDGWRKATKYGRKLHVIVPRHTLATNLPEGIYRITDFIVMVHDDGSVTLNTHLQENTRES